MPFRKLNYKASNWFTWVDLQYVLSRHHLTASHNTTSAVLILIHVTLTLLQNHRKKYFEGIFRSLHPPQKTSTRPEWGKFHELWSHQILSRLTGKDESSGTKGSPNSVISNIDKTRKKNKYIYIFIYLYINKCFFYQNSSTKLEFKLGYYRQFCNKCSGCDSAVFINTQGTPLAPPEGNGLRVSFVLGTSLIWMSWLLYRTQKNTELLY